MIVFQKSFASGELAPALYARTDLIKYATGARTMRNMFTGKHGGAYNRCGTLWCSDASDSTHRIRVIPFSLPGNVYYQLEFGHLYMRVLQNGQPVMTTPKTIQSITKAASAVITLGAPTGIKVGDQVSFSGCVGMTQMNGLTGNVTAVSANLVTTDINSTSFSTYTGSGIMTPVTPRAIVITSPYTEDMLRQFTFQQTDKTMEIAHQSGYPSLVSYNSIEFWTLLQSVALVQPAIGRTSFVTGPTSTFEFFISGTANATSGATYTNNGVTFTVTNTISAGAILTCSATALPTLTGVLTKASGTGDATITFSSFQQFGVFFIGITAVAQDTFEEGPITIWAVANGTALPYKFTWTPVLNAIQYNIYVGPNPQTLGFLDTIGNAASPSYSDDGVTLKADMTSPPPIEKTIFAYNGANSTGNMLPAAVGYFQQRKFYGNMGPPVLGWPGIIGFVLPLLPNYSDRIYGSRIGSPTYFNIARPTPDDGMLAFRLLNRINQTIRHFLDVGKLAVFTEEGEWILAGDPNSGGITPALVNPTNVSQNGSGYTPPIPIGATALYVQFNQQKNKSIVRTFGYQFQSDGYRGDDTTIYSSHLFKGHQIVAWDYQKLPDPIVWAAREDGILLGLTYLPEQQLLAWHRHDFTNGLVEDVISSGGDIYLVIQRTINGVLKRCIEKFADREFEDVVDAVFVDSCVTFDGRNTDPTKTMTLSGGTTWEDDEEITITSSSSFFTSDSVGRFIHLTGPNGELIRFEISGFSSGTVAQGNPNKLVPASMRSVALSTWTDARVTINGLDHLEGQKVSVLADGFVLASPNNTDGEYLDLTVTGGAITLGDGDVGFGVVHVGLPYISDLETLNIDNPQGPSMVDKKKLINKVSVWFEDTRGVFVGTQPPDDDSQDPLDGLTTGLDESKYRYDEGYDDPSKLITRVIEINTQGQWNNHGRVLLRQVDPLPMGVLAVAPEGFIPVGVP